MLLPVAFARCFLRAVVARMGKRSRMRWRVMLILSLGANLILCAAWLVSSRRYETLRETVASQKPPPEVVKTNVVIRRQFFTWSEVESPNYPTYIANLRDIGCPEQTIRDIIIADVNALFARRQATEITTTEQQWWRSTPDPDVAAAAARKVRELDQERRALLAQLLGADWESRDLANLPRPSRPTVALDGPVLGGLPDKVKESVQDVSARAQERLQAYLEKQRQDGKDPDPAELAKLRQQTRDELAGLLTPPQLEEYLLRYSQDANDLRASLGQLKYFNATPDEFRALFRATDPIDEQLQLLAGKSDNSSVLQRDSLLQQRQNAIKLALGADRYQQYVLLHDPAYREAYASAQEAGDPGVVQTLYQINLATAQEQAAIRSNADLTPEQMAIRLKQTELDQLHAKAQALGEEAVPQPPQPETPQTPPMRTHAYVLGTGETAATIATMYGVSLEAIRAANPGVDIRRLKPGQSIQVPDSLPTR